MMYKKKKLDTIGVDSNGRNTIRLQLQIYLATDKNSERKI